MSLEFPRRLALLRKEMSLSQKQVAGDLGVSQALLSHYEKGIRNPNLNFLVRCADYYKVSTDYLLGRSPDPQGATLRVDDIPSAEESNKGNVGVSGVYAQLNKKLLANSQGILFDLLTRLGHKDLTRRVSSYLMLSTYRMFRLVYSANPKNQTAFFSVPEQAFSPYTDAAMSIVDAYAKAISSGTPLNGGAKVSEPEALTITTESLAQEYPLFASSLLNLIQTAENRINNPHGGKK